MRLVIANKNYSSWSLRPWLLMTEFGLDFELRQESLAGDDLKERLRQYSPSCKVPVLIDGDLTVWDSLAICEYISERYLGGDGWPMAVDSGAHARAICAEMHSGFMTYDAELSKTAQGYMNSILNNSGVKDWMAAADRETEIIPEDEAGDELQ